jgi:hypothetical protein
MRQNSALRIIVIVTGIVISVPLIVALVALLAT